MFCLMFRTEDGKERWFPAWEHTPALVVQTHQRRALRGRKFRDAPRARLTGERDDDVIEGVGDEDGQSD